MPVAMSKKKKQYRNQPAITKGPIENDMMYFKMSVAIWRDERLNRNQKAILGQILSHRLDGDEPYIIHRDPILEQLGYNPNNKNIHWNELKELGYLRYEKIGSGGRWIIDETIAKDSKWYKAHHPNLNLSKEMLEDLKQDSATGGVESETVKSKGAENNGGQNNALSNNKDKEEQYQEETNEEIFSFSEDGSGFCREDQLNMEDGLSDNKTNKHPFIPSANFHQEEKITIAPPSSSKTGGDDSLRDPKALSPNNRVGSGFNPLLELKNKKIREEQKAGSYTPPFPSIKLPQINN
jgi:hypothetical protein